VTRCLRRYGDPFTLPVLYATWVITGDPEEARRIFTADPELFGPMAGDEVRFLLGDASFPRLSGDPHLASRRLLAPPFLGARMRAYGRIMADAATRAFGRMPSGAEFKAQDTGQAISLDVILEAVFGVSDPERKARFRHSIIELLSSSSGVSILLRPLQREFGPVTPASMHHGALIVSQDFRAGSCRPRRPPRPVRAATGSLPGADCRRR
jgi:cytochrome P450